MALSTKTDKYSRLPLAASASLKDYQRLWLVEALGEQDAEVVFTLPRDLVKGLYGDILKYGPNSDAVIAVRDAVHARLDEMKWFTVKQDLRGETPFPAMADFYHLGAQNLYMQSFIKLMTEAWTEEGQRQVYMNFNHLVAPVTADAHRYIELERIVVVKHQLLHLVTAVGVQGLLHNSRKNSILTKKRDAALDELGCLHVVS